ncbi:MAG: hypothetical protein PHC88_01790 [Terrimicrobiaceae bacterium]|nr:hypothetical protein [Terrimicrobiaceae bacterium]
MTAPVSERWFAVIHRAKLRGILLSTLLAAAALSPARATFHLWQIIEVYSDATGTVQYVELTTNSPDEDLLAGHTFKSSTNTFTFGGNLSGSTAGRHLLLATPGYFALPGVPPADFNLGKNNFFNVNGDTLDYAGVNTLTFTAGQLPLDGTNSLNRAFNPPTPTTFTVAAMSPMNFGVNSSTPSAPKVTIRGPSEVTTEKEKLVIRGKAKGIVTSVKFRVGRRGAFKPATGSTSWHFIAALKPGKNLITVIARGPGGNSTPVKITVIRT